MFGLSNQHLMLGGIVLLFLLSKAGNLKPLLEKLASYWRQGVTTAKGVLSPQETVADIMAHLKALDAYSDAHNLEWGESLKNMLAAVGKIEFDREPTSESN